LPFDPLPLIESAPEDDAAADPTMELGTPWPGPATRTLFPAINPAGKFRAGKLNGGMIGAAPFTTAASGFPGGISPAVSVVAAQSALAVEAATLVWLLLAAGSAAGSGAGAALASRIGDTFAAPFGEALFRELLFRESVFSESMFGKSGFSKAVFGESFSNPARPAVAAIAGG
jgi:hypothetical protein